MCKVKKHDWNFAVGSVNPPQMSSFAGDTAKATKPARAHLTQSLSTPNLGDRLQNIISITSFQFLC